MKKKLKLKSNKKAYLQIDFAFAMFMFLLVFVFCYNHYVSYKNIIREENEISKLTLDAQDLCFLLTHSTGYPNNWETNIDNTVQFGFVKNNEKELDISKINQFTDSNYFTIIDNLNIEDNLYIKIKDINSSNVYLDFGATVKNGVLYSDYKCFANYNSSIVEVYVEVWK